MSVALRYSYSREEASEILNDSFLKVFQNLKHFKAEKSFKSWFRRILINTSIDHYRKIKNINQTECIDDKTELNIAEKNLENLEFQDLQKLLKTLPKLDRLIFNLYETEGYKHEEIAEKLNISASTSRANLSRAKKKLREALEKTYKENYAKVV